MGLARRRRGKGFSYVDSDGAPVGDDETLDRIRELAIPPAWRDVWICVDPMGHIQATGFDEAGRKQYLYHPRWHERQSERKFENMREFARSLPRLRRIVTRDLKATEMTRERALACAVRLLDIGMFRVGGEVYAEANESFGLATVRREHVSVGKTLLFDFPAKSGQRLEQEIDDPAVTRAVAKMCRRRSGPDDLLVYRDKSGWHDVRSADINEYIQETIGEGFSAKDFRTWHGTVIAAVELAVKPSPQSEAAIRRAIKESVEAVADALGNTPTVSRNSYIDPRVFDRFRNGEVIKPVAPGSGARMSQRSRRLLERRVLELVS